ncbi:MAG: aspartyl protease family protein [Proteobacteria bacterium]|nr:aspartyl protease family protein [Pseudomonadota bacterium]
MRLAIAAFALATVAAVPALAGSPDDILAANRAASGGDAWNGKAALYTAFDYAGGGLTGKAEGTVDLTTGAFEQHYQVGPQTGANGYDGTHVWNKDNAGIVTLQEAADSVPVAINNAYRNANLWWRKDHGGATVTDAGQKTDGGNSYDVLTITPKGGKPFNVWFDTRTHLIYRITEVQGGVTVTTTLTNYQDFSGTEQPVDTVINTGDAKYDQHLVLTSAKFLAKSDPATYAPPKSAPADFSIAGGAHSVTFPFQLIANHIYADVTINGKGPYNFIFDTGGVNLINPELAKELGIKLEGTSEARGAGDASMEASLARVDRIDVGGARIDNQVFIALALDALYPADGVHMRGMVGYETFRRFVTRIDYGAKTVTLTDPKFFDPKDAGTPIHIAFAGNAVIVSGSYEGVPGKFQIDTGARSALTLNGPYVAANDLLAKAGKGVDAVDGWGVGGPSRAHVVRGGPLVIGKDVTVQSTVVGFGTDKAGAFADPSLSGNIGGGVLKRFVVTFDYANNTMYLKPVTQTVTDLDTFDRFGAWINIGKDGLDVVAVTANGPAAAAGLKQGDVITAIDGKAASDIVLPDLRERFRDEAPGTVVSVALKDGRTLKVTLKDQI